MSKVSWCWRDFLRWVVQNHHHHYCDEEERRWRFFCRSWWWWRWCVPKNKRTKKRLERKFTGLFFIIIIICIMMMLMSLYEPPHPTVKKKWEIIGMACETSCLTGSQLNEETSSQSSFGGTASSTQRKTSSFRMMRISSEKRWKWNQVARTTVFSMFSTGKHLPLTWDRSLFSLHPLFDSLYPLFSPPLIIILDDAM